MNEPLETRTIADRDEFSRKRPSGVVATSVTARRGDAPDVAPSHPAFLAKTGAILFLKQALLFVFIFFMCAADLLRAEQAAKIPAARSFPGMRAFLILCVAVLAGWLEVVWRMGLTGRTGLVGLVGRITLKWS